MFKLCCNFLAKGYAILYNPTSEMIQRSITLPLYYTGLKEKAMVAVDGKVFQSYTLNRAYEIDVNIPANGSIGVVIK